MLAMFLHENVTHCTFIDKTRENKYDSRPSSLGSLCYTIEARTPFLTHLMLDIPPKPDFRDLLANLLRSGLKNATMIELPAFRDISPILPFAGCHPKVQSLKFGKYEFRLNSPSQAVETVGLRDNSNASFLLLERISFGAVEFRALCDFFVDSFQKLRFVNILTCIVEDPSTVRGIVSCISESCPNLCSFQASFAEALSKHIDISSSENVLHLEDIMPMLQCSSMTHFDFQHLYPFNITDSDIQAIALAWPKLIYISICPKSHCPLIEEIHLLIDTNALFISNNSPRQSRKLQVVGVGRSPILNQHEVALNFNQFCAPHVKLDFDEAWFEGTHNKGMLVKWRGVREVLPLLNELKARLTVGTSRPESE
ncbi:hypothetical protein VKT23_004911 [Stygiomarasmius scandens]|uniref:F-box protein n=1 Tax=Marasmiellus scandens TaxID=2682957 RepID=A0ABR1JW57_9AGAR